MLKARAYFVKLLMWLVSTSLVGWWLFRFVIPQHAFTAYFAIPAVILVMGGAFYFLLNKIQGLPIKNSFMWFMLNTVFKMAVSAAFIILVLIKNKESLVAFGFTYLVFYLLLLLFETSWFMKVSKSSPHGH